MCPSGFLPGAIFVNLYKVKQLLTVKHLHSEVALYKQGCLSQSGKESVDVLDMWVRLTSSGNRYRL